MRLALITGGRVENVIVAEPDFITRAAEYLSSFETVVELEATARPDDPRIGWAYDGTSFAPARPEDPEELRALELAEASKAAREQIASGFEYDGHRFSLSIEAQATLTSTFLVRDALAWPLKWATIDDGKVIEIADAKTFEAFYAASVVALRSALDTSNDAKARAIEASAEAIAIAVEVKG